MKILATILSYSGTQQYADACKETWIKTIESPHDYFFYGDKKQSESMDKTWDCEPDEGECRGRLPQKTFKMLNKALEYDWDFLFKCDDDTFVNFKELVNLLSHYDHESDIYLGHRLCNPFPYAQGGAGYVLSRTALVKCINSFKNFYFNAGKTKQAEDYAIGLALQEEGVDLIHNQLIDTPTPNIAREDQSWCVDSIVKRKKITTHYVRPETMREIYISY
jgi:hypothetical protein